MNHKYEMQPCTNHTRKCKFPLWTGPIPPD